MTSAAEDESDSVTQPRNIKTTTACDRCRNKKRKCDGNRPTCRHCHVAGHECTYAGRQKPRGPVAGHLRTLERRVVWLESFIAYLSENIWDDETTNGSTALKGLFLEYLAESDARSDANWEALQAIFDREFRGVTVPSHFSQNIGPTTLRMKRRMVDREDGSSGIGGDMARERRRDSASPVQAGYYPNSSVPPHRPSNSVDEGEPLWDNFHQEPPFGGADHSMEDEETLPMDAAFLTQSLGLHGRGSMANVPAFPASSMTADNASWMNQCNEHSQAFEQAVMNSALQQQPDLETSGASASGQGLRTDIQGTEPSFRGLNEGFMSTSISRQAFDLDYDSSLRQILEVEDVTRMLSTTLANPQIETPPKEVQDHLIQLHLLHVHPLLPFLDRDQLVAYVSAETTAQNTDRSPPSRILILAICAYSACLSPTLGGLAPDVDSLNQESSAGGSLAEFWAEEARSTLMASTLKRRCGIDTIQTIILLVLRDHGKAQHFQAWLWLGIAIRTAQDIGLHQADPNASTGPESHQRKRLWTTLCFMDVMLSLQLGRPSAIEFDLEVPDRDLLGSGYGVRAFDHLPGICRLLQEIRRNLYGARSVTVPELDTIKERLQNWKASLPNDLQGILGEDVPPDVALLLMLYHTAVLLAWRPLERIEGLVAIKPTSLATTAFKVLLDGVQTMSNGGFSALHCCPQTIYTVFTVAISLISAIRQLRTTADVNPTSLSAILTARVSLLSCTEALGELAKTWPLARRCHDILQRLTEAEQLQTLHTSHLGQVTPSGNSFPPATPNRAQRLNMAGPSDIPSDLSGQLQPRTMHDSIFIHDAGLQLPFQTAEWTSNEDLYAMLNFDCSSLL